MQGSVKPKMPLLPTRSSTSTWRMYIVPGWGSAQSVSCVSCASGKGFDSTRLDRIGLDRSYDDVFVCCVGHLFYFGEEGEKKKKKLFR